MSNGLTDVVWERQPRAAAFVKSVCDELVAHNAFAADFARRVSEESGNRFTDLVDTIFLGNSPDRVQNALDAGWRQAKGERGWDLFAHPGGMFPRLAVDSRMSGETLQIAVKAERVVDFLAAHRLPKKVLGKPMGPYRWAEVHSEGPATLAVIERHGHAGLFADRKADPNDVAEVSEAFRLRDRDSFADEAEAWATLEALVHDAVGRLGQDLACDLFFAAEREYWQTRNAAARWQKGRQDRLGIGWANHDHHTYRSSRRNFAKLVRLFEAMGFHCRERFSPGKLAGWGAQVMEQPVCGIVTFNDVDIDPEELLGDFAHDGLDDRDELKTVGLWCALHGDSLFEAGMHHLECTFDFEKLQAQMEAEAGIQTMKKFTDFPHLKQAFTEGERWVPSEDRLVRCLDRGQINQDQAQDFRTRGAVGSHLENLERNDGFKGFNQDGVTEIIQATDPRKLARA